MNTRNFLDLIEQAENQSNDPDSLIKNTNALYAEFKSLDENELITIKKTLERIKILNKKRADVLIASITDLVYEIVLKLTSEDLADPKSYAPDLNPSVIQELDEFSEFYLPLYIQNDILSASHLEHRNLLIEQWIFAAKECLTRNNYIVAKSIYIALYEEKISKLIEVNKKYIGLSLEAVGTLYDLIDFFSNTHKIEERVKITDSPILISIKAFSAAAKKLSGRIETNELKIITYEEAKNKKISEQSYMTPAEKGEAQNIITKDLETFDVHIEELTKQNKNIIQLHQQQCATDFQSLFKDRNYDLSIDRKKISLRMQTNIMAIKEDLEIKKFILANREVAYCSYFITKYKEKIARIELTLQELEEQIMVTTKYCLSVDNQWKNLGMRLQNIVKNIENEQIKKENLLPKVIDLEMQIQKASIKKKEFEENQNLLSPVVLEENNLIKEVPEITYYPDSVKINYFKELATKIVDPTSHSRNDQPLPARNTLKRDNKPNLNKYRRIKTKEMELAPKKTLPRSTSKKGSTIVSDFKVSVKEFATYGADLKFSSVKNEKPRLVEDILIMMGSKVFNHEEKLKLLYIEYMSAHYNKKYFLIDNELILIYIQKFIFHYEARQKNIEHSTLELKSGCDAFDQLIKKLKNNQDTNVKCRAKLAILNPIQKLLSSKTTSDEKIQYIQNLPIAYEWLEAEIAILKEYKNTLLKKTIKPLPLNQELPFDNEKKERVKDIQPTSLFNPHNLSFSPRRIVQQRSLGSTSNIKKKLKKTNEGANAKISPTSTDIIEVIANTPPASKVQTTSTETIPPLSLNSNSSLLLPGSKPPSTEQPTIIPLKRPKN